MGINLERYIERFYFTPEGRESFLKNLAGISQKAISEDGFCFHPEYFWEEDLSGWPDEDRLRLLNWLSAESKAAAMSSTEDYDYSVAPKTIEELEEKVMQIHFASAIWRVLQLRERYRLSVIFNDEFGRTIRRYADGRIEYIYSKKRAGK